MRRLVDIVSLDIKATFDYACCPFIRAQLASKNYPADIYDLVDSYLSDRSITFEYAGVVVSKPTI